MVDKLPKKAKMAILGRLRASIPDVRCNRCGKCCHDIILCSTLEWEIIRKKDERYYDDSVIRAIEQGCTNVPPCPYLGPNGCEIYEERPIICRLFGASEARILRCKAGLRSPRELSWRQTADLTFIYFNTLIGVDLSNVAILGIGPIKQQQAQELVDVLYRKFRR